MESLFEEVKLAQPALVRSLLNEGPVEQHSIEAFIARLDLKKAYDFFIALQPENLRAGSTSFKLTSEQKTLLQFIRSFKHEDISKLFTSAMEDLSSEESSLSAFEEKLQEKFREKKPQDKLNILLQTSSDRLILKFLEILEAE